MANPTPHQDQYELVQRFSFEHTDDLEATNIHERLDSPTSHRNNPVSSKAESHKQSSEDVRSLIAAHSSPSFPRKSWFRSPRLPAWFTDSWALEIAASVLSIACMIAIVVVLAWIDGKPIEAWHFYIQPNTIVSILSTVAKSSLLLPVAEAISQQKWQYYQSPRPRKLNKIDIFDQASRGPYGAVLILFSIRTIPAILGALVTLTALGMDPFVQQIITFEQGTLNLDHNSSQVAISQILDTGRPVSGPVEPSDIFPTRDNSPVELQAAFYSGLYANPLKPNVQCNAPSCTWDGYSTLGVCSKCLDVTSTTTKTCRSGTVSPGNGYACNYTTPANFSLSAIAQDGPHTTKATLFGSSALDWIHLDQKGNSSKLINQLLHFAAFKFPDDDNTFGDLRKRNVTLYECSLRFCGKTYPGLNFTNTTYTEPVPAEWDFISVTPEWTEEAKLFQGFIPPANISSSPGHPTGNWTVNRSDWADTASFLAQLFTAPSTAPTNVAGADPNQAVPGQLYRAALPQTMADIATSMSNAIRNGGARTVSGTAFRDQTRIRVRWAWISLPVAVVLAGNVLLLMVMWKSARRQTPLWRSSSLALLYHGLEHPSKEMVETMAQMERAAETARVRISGASPQDMKLVDA